MSTPLTNEPGSPAREDAIPKTLFMYWHQGWSNAPDIVRRCCETWIKHNPTWNIHMMDAENIEKNIIVPSVAKELRLPLPALSDVLRICLLQKWGGGMGGCYFVVHEAPG